jgi:hypothetical protein
MGLHFHFPQQWNSLPCSESRLELWFGCKSYLHGGRGGAFFILVLCFILYDIKVKKKIALPFHVIMTIINTRFSVVKNAMGFLSQQYKKHNENYVILDTPSLMFL